MQEVITDIEKDITAEEPRSLIEAYLREIELLRNGGDQSSSFTGMCALYIFNLYECIT